MKIFLIILLIFILCILTVGIQLLSLRASVDSYSKYWKNKLTQTGEITYVALGNSAAQAVGASKPENGYVGLIAKQIEASNSRRVRVVNLSVSGATIDSVIEQQLPQLKQYKPDIVTIDIGGNDVARDYQSQAFKDSFTKLATQLPPNTIVGNIPYFGGRIRKNKQALDANNHIVEVSKAYKLPVADLQTITRDRNSITTYAIDYFHPSDKGYQNWFDAYWMVLEDKLPNE